MTVIQKIIDQAGFLNKKIVFCEYRDYRILKALTIVQQKKIARPLLLGNRQSINESAGNFKLDLGD
ncbi:MAG: phosphate acetyltransferase, partial [Spirochaetes bacterium]|nr:phosphate acetyltransferase [Spirochaetota bacterium]